MPTQNNPVRLFLLLTLLFTVSLLLRDRFTNSPQGEEGTKTTLGIQEITIFYSEGEGSIQKINRIAHKRSPSKIPQIAQEASQKDNTPNTVSPTYSPLTQRQEFNLGESLYTKAPKPEEETKLPPTPKIFPPLLQVTTTGVPGTIYLEGDLFVPRTKIKTNKAAQTIPIYPQYFWQNPEGALRSKETLRINFIPEGSTQAVDPEEIEITWSGEDEIFLTDSSLAHIAYFVNPKANLPLRFASNNRNSTVQEVYKWMQETGRKLGDYKILYEELPSMVTDPGWQKIRSPEDVLQQRKGNCLDLSILWASLATHHNIQTWIIITPEHALTAFAPLGAPLKEAIPLETTHLTGQNSINKDILDDAILIGKTKITEWEGPQNTSKVIPINVQKWQSYFQ